MRLVLLPLFLIASAFGFSQDGTVDLTFGSSGQQAYIPPSGDIYNDINKTIVLPNNKILHCFSVYNSATGNHDFGLARYDMDGYLDPTFDGDAGNANGIVLTDFGADEVATSLTVQSDGKIIVAGYKYTGAFITGPRQFAIARYNANGTLDVGFDGNSGTGNGKFTTGIGTDAGAYSVAESGGKIVLAGFAWTGSSQYVAVAVYSGTNGMLDVAFNSTGIRTTAVSGAVDGAYAVKMQADGKIVAAGFSFDGAIRTFALIRYTTAGALDNSFDADGIVTTIVGSGGFDEAYDMVIQSDGKIVAAGGSNNGTSYDFAVVRYTTTGALDNTFSSIGKKIFSFGTGDDIAYSLMVQPNGKIVAAGITSNGTDNDFAIVRFTANGNLDNTSFNNSPVPPVVAGTNVIDFAGDNYGYAIAAQGTKIIVSGIAGVSTASTRLNNSGGGTLPVDLFSFTASKQNNSVLLNWQTSKEEDSWYFEVERSGNGRNFSSIGKVNAAGNSLATSRYLLKDVQPLQPINYYRLRIVNTDGSFAYSKVLVVKMTSKATIEIFPNPVKDIVILQLPEIKGSVNVEIKDAIGRLIKRYEYKGSNITTTLDLSFLKKGLYFISANGEAIKLVKE